MGNFRSSWTYQLVSPFVRDFLAEREWPDLISFTQIADAFKESNPSSQIPLVEHNIGRALIDYGYCRVSAAGAGFVQTPLGIYMSEIAGLREIPAECIP